MKQYIGTKVVNAQPMTRLAYNEFRGWQLPADENGADEGYLVEYVDGGKANTEQYAGYVSWSPKDVFERAYVEQVELDFKGRAVKERAELDAKIAPLFAFVHDSPKDVFKGLEAAEQARLRRQLEVMCEYSNILKERIANFVGVPA